jgi:serine protease AprX
MKNPRPLFILAGALAAMLAVAPVSAQDAGTRPSDKIHKLDKRLRESLSKAPRPERVIIRTKDGQRAALRLALQAHGDVVTEDHPEVGALSAVVHGEDLLALANDPTVESVSVDATVRADGVGRVKVRKAQDLETAVAAATKQALEASRKATRAARQAAARAVRRAKAQAEKGAQAKWPKAVATGDLRKLQGLYGYAPTGRGVGVAVIDSGIEADSKDLSFDISAFVDFTQGPHPVYRAPYDDYGHGTFVASMIANDGQGDAKYQGMAPGVHLIGLKVLDQNGNGLTSAVIQAIEFAIANKDALDIDIINLSLGHPIFESAATDPLVIAVEQAHAAGITVVASAGNFGTNPTTGQVGYGGITSPGNAPSAITVGAVDQNKTARRDDDSVASFSSRGPTWIDGFAKPDIVAPGVNEVSRMAKAGNLLKLFPQLQHDAGGGGPADLAKLSGTSMAAAAASGIVAVVMQANPDLPPNAIKAVLEYTATPLGDAKGQPLDALTQGAGEVNAAGAVALAKAIDTDSGASGWVVGDVPLSTWFGNQDQAWSQNIVWGNYFVAGLPAVMFANGLPYDDNIVWGTIGRATDDNIVWGSFARDGDNIVWGNLALWGSRYDTEQRDNIVWGNFARVDDNIVWGSFDRGGDNIVWGSFFRGDDNIVWGSVTRDGDNIVWGNNIVWANNIVWGNALLGARSDGNDNIVWGNLYGWDGNVDNIVWGNLYDDNIVWGNAYDDNIVWGNSVTSVGF